MANVKLNIVTATNMQGLNQLEAKLKDLKALATSGNSIMTGTYSAVEIQKTVNAVNTLQHALRAAYDTKLNTVNIEKFNQYLTKSKMSVQDLYINLSRMGAEGRKVFMDMTQQTLMMGRSVKQTNALVTEMQTTMKNTVKWGISSGLWNNMLSSVSQAWTYVKGLNSDLNDIRVVTGKSANEMERFAKTANKTAKELAVSTRDYTQGALLYYQQGDDEETVKTKTDITAKASNVTGQDMSTVSEQLTAVWNGYQVANQAATEGMQVYEQYVDKLAAVAATTASDLEEQATAMSKVASAAYSMGVDFDDLNAQISTIVSVTRQAPESVGTALKTIYARLGDLKVDGVDEFGVKLGEVSSQLQTMGVDVLDANGEMRDMSDVMEEVAGKWKTWTSAQKEAAAVAMAGKRQYNNLIALFDNQDMYNKALSTSMEANGTLAEQQAIAVEDLDSKLQKLATSTEKIYDALFNEESVGGLIDAFTVVVDLIGSAVQGIGGLGVLIPAIGGKLLKSFGSDIGNAVAKKVENKRVRARELKNDDAKLQLAAQLGNSGQFLKEDEGQQNSLMAKEQKVVTDYYKEMARFRKNMTDEEIVAYNTAMKNRAEVANTKLELQDTIEILKEKNQLTEKQYDIVSKLNKNENITEKDKQELENLKEKIKLQQMLAEQADATVITENLGKKGVSSGIEARRSKVATNLEKEKETIANNIIQHMQNDGTIDDENIEASQQAIENMLEKAVKKGYSTKEALKNIQAQLVEINGYEYSGGYFKEIEGFLNETEQDIEGFSKNIENNFDEHIGKPLQQAFGPKSQGIIDELKKKVVSLVNKGKTFEEAYVEAMSEVKKEAEDVGQALQDIDISNIDLDNADFEIKGLLETQELKTAMEGLSSAAGGVIQIFAGLSGVMNSFKSAMDPSLDTTERLSAAFTGLISSGFIIVSAINSIAQATNSLKTATNAQTTAEALRRVVMTVIGKLSKQNAQNTTNETAQMRNNTEAVHENTAALIANEAAERATQSAMSSTTTAATTAGGAMTTMGGAAATSAGSTAAAGGAVAGLGTAATAAGVALVALVAIIAVVVISMEAHQKALEKNAETTQENYDKHKKLTTQLQEEKKAWDEIVDSYENLSHQYENNEITLHDLRKQTADLLLQYGKQDEALRALCADYETLNELILREREIASGKYLEQGEISQNASKENMAAQMYAKADESFRDEHYGKMGFDVYHGLFDVNSDAVLDVLSEYGVEASGAFKHIYVEDFVDAIVKNYDEIYNKLAAIDGSVAKNLISAMDSVKDQVEEYNTFASELETTEKDQIIASSAKNVSNALDYYKALTNIVDEYQSKGYFTEEEREKAIKEAEAALTSALADKTIATDYEIAKKKASQEGKELSSEYIQQVQNNLANFSASEKSWIYLHLGVIDANTTWAEFVEESKTYIDRLNKQTNQITIDVVLRDPNIKEIPQETLDSLFDNTDFEKITGFSQEEFEFLDFETQRALMLQYYTDAEYYREKNHQADIQYQKELKAKYDQLKTDISQDKNDLVNTTLKIDKDDIPWNDQIKEAYKIAQNKANFDKLQGRNGENFGKSDIDNALEYILAQMKEDESLTFDKIWSSLINRSISAYEGPSAERDAAVALQVWKSVVPGAQGQAEDLVMPVLEDYRQQGKDLEEDYQAADNASKDAASAVTALEGQVYSYAESVEYAHTLQEQSLNSLSNLYSEYKGLTDIIESYNTTGGYNIDSITTLLSLSDDMLSCLELENGQLALNTNKVKELVIARLRHSQALITEEYRAKLLNLVQQSTQEQMGKTQSAEEKLTNDTYDLAVSAGVASDTFRQLAIGVSGLTEKDLVGVKGVDELLENWEKEYSAVNNMVDELLNGDFASVMGDKELNIQIKTYDDEFDRYWDLNNAIEKTTQAVDELADAQNKLTRGELQDNLKEQNQLLGQQIKNYEKLRKEQEKEAAELRGELLNYGADFAVDGSLTNYAELTAKALEYYNDAVEKRQRGAITDAQLDVAEKTYDAFKESLERYDELYYSEMVETTENIADAQKQILENSLEDFEVGIQIVIDEEDFNRNLNDFLEQANNDITKHFEDLNSKQQYISFDVQSYKTSLDATLKGYAQVAEEVKKLANGHSSTMFESLSQAQEKLKELTEDSIEYASNIGDAFEEIWDNYLAGIDQADDELQEAMEGYERVNETLEYQAELIELIYGPEAYDLLDALYKQQQNNSLSQIQSLKAQKDMWAELYESAAGNSEDQAKYFELMNEAQSQLNENVTAYIELLKNEYANTIDNILSKLENTLANGSTFEDIGEQWERMTEHTDKYYDSLESIYHIQTLSNDVAQDIANMSDVKDQQKLQKVLDKQLKLLREKENLSQTDLDIAQKKLDIVKAEIALEEARASKTSMRLVRNYDGNWSYQYIADADNVAIKQQELIDLQYELYQLNQDAYTSTLEAITNLEQTTLEKWKEIATSEVLNQEEKEAKIAELLAYYTEQKDLLVEESEVYKQGLAETTAGLAWSLYQSDTDNFKEMTDTEQELVLALQDTTVDSYADIEEKVKENLDNIGDKAHTVATENIPELTSAAANFATEWIRDEDGVRATVQQAIDDMMAAMDQFQIKVDEVAGVVEGDFGEEGIKGAIDSTTTATQAVETAITNLCNNTPSKLATLKTNVDKIAGAWEDVKDQIEYATTALSNYYALEVPPKDGTEDTNTDDNSDTGSGNNSGWTPITDNFDITVDDKDYQIYSVSPHGDGKYMLAREEERMSVPIATHKTKKEMLQEIQKVIHTGALVKFQGIKWSSEVGDIIQYATDAEVRAGSFDTGGYTGEWGSTGRMAFLHEKELILNKEDTKNILAAVNGIRQFSSVESAITRGIASMIMNMAGVGVNANYNTNEAKGNQTEQVFNITAEFPNANNVSEIREAILSLPGLASQQVGLNLI